MSKFSINDRVKTEEGSVGRIVTITVDEMKRMSIDWNKDYNNYTMLCPYCNEQLTLDEVESKQCIYCRTDFNHLRQRGDSNEEASG